MTLVMEVWVVDSFFRTGRVSVREDIQCKADGTVEEKKQAFDVICCC
jgi:hypothetical protein